MSMMNIIRAWKDEEFRRSLSDAERAALPDHPVGNVDLTDIEMAGVEGGARAPNDTYLFCTLHSWGLFTYGCCGE
jgi:mersacidin/lichenicidin family type 2 lantibiotic